MLNLTTAHECYPIFYTNKSWNGARFYVPFITKWVILEMYTVTTTIISTHNLSRRNSEGTPRLHNRHWSFFLNRVDYSVWGIAADGVMSQNFRHWSAEMHANGLLGSAEPGTDRAVVKKTADGCQVEECLYITADWLLLLLTVRISLAVCVCVCVFVCES